MGAVFKGLIASAVLAGSSLPMAAPAEARDRTGTAIVAGMIGLGIGAVIASDNHRDQYRGYSDERRPNGYYSSGPSYYGSSYIEPRYYSGAYGYDRNDGYRAGRRGYDGYDNGYAGHDRYRRDRDDDRW